MYLLAALYAASKYMQTSINKKGNSAAVAFFIDAA